MVADVKIPKMMFTALLSALRPKQWIKNLLVFAPLVFSREFLNPGSVKLAVIVFGIFCATASGIYLLNDLLDRDSDKKHFIKKQRAIASGKLSPKIAAATSATLIIVSIFLAAKLSLTVAGIIVGYIFLQIAYSVFLKHITIIDLLAIASGFILRIFAGGAAINVEISNWLLAITFLLALLLATGKRLREVESTGIFSRKVLENYSPQFLKTTIQILLPAILVSYLFYSFQANDSPHFIFTVPIMVYGLLRYLFLIEKKSANENPTDLLLEDKPLLVSVVLWGISVIAILSLA